MPDLYGNSASVADFGGFNDPAGQAFLKENDWAKLGPMMDEVYANPHFTTYCEKPNSDSLVGMRISSLKAFNK